MKRDDLQLRPVSISVSGGPLLLLLAILILAGCKAPGEEEQGPDPVVQDFAISYVKRPQGMESDLRRQLGFTPGADLFLRDLASPSANELNLTNTLTGGMGDVRGIDVSYDGARLLFAMRLPDGEAPSTWNIWEYDTETDSLRRVIASDLVAGAGDDLSPRYLPDGRILFASTRQHGDQARLVDEGKPQFVHLDEDRREPALALHVMNDDGSDIRQISFNPSHDFDPLVLSSGEIVFSRWDNMGGRNAIHLYRMRPDGTGMQVLYGAHSHDDNGVTTHLVQAREMPDGRLLALQRPFSGSEGGGRLVLVDAAGYIDDAEPVAGTVPAGPAQVSATIHEVSTRAGLSPGGRFRSAWPLRDGSRRLLVSWSPCRVQSVTRIEPCAGTPATDVSGTPAPPLYSLFVYDMNKGTQTPVVLPEEGISFSDVAVLQPRPRPVILNDAAESPGSDLAAAAEGAGILHIRSVYDVDGVDTAVPDTPALADPARTTAAQRQARFLRLVKAVDLPDDDVLDLPGTAFGRSQGQLMREIVAYAPIEPDGSIKIMAPADVALTLEVLDADGRRIGPRHQNWFQLRPGETLECNGCHDHRDGRRHGRRDAAASANPGAPTTGLSFPNTRAGLWADYGESMAETRTRISCLQDCSALRPGLDIVFEDAWTDPDLAGREADASFAYRYADLRTPAPVSAECQSRWSASCRIVIHYERHIHPLWGLDRGEDTCTRCHAPADAGGQARVPAAQLDLTDGMSDQQPAHFKSYHELFYNDNEQEVDGSVLRDRLVQATGADGTPLFATDADGELLLDANGDPVPVMVTVTVRPVMTTAGARASRRFFAPFAAGGSHAGRLEPAELRLLSEWLDIGAQYYNDPFAVPVD